MLRRARSLRVRLTLWYLSILLLILTIFAGAVYVVLANGLRAEVDRSLELAAQQAVTISQDSQLRLNEEGLPRGYSVSLYAPDGRLLESSGRRERLPAGPEISQTLARGRQVWRSLDFDDDEWRVLARPVVVDGRMVAVLQVARSEEVVEDAVEQLGALLTMLVPLALVLAGAGGLFLAGRALGPIDRITRTAAAIGADDLARRLPIQTAATPDEVGRLAITFNRMLDRLEAAFRRQRQFTADASHELRTPVTLLLNQLDVALERPRSAEEYRRVLTSLRDDASGLRRLLDALLALARADAHQEVPRREPLNLGQLAQQVVETMQPLAEERGIRLEAAIHSGVAVEGDEARLIQLVVNLVDNALQYTPAGGAVTVTVARDADSTVLVVRDSGVGIAAEHLPHVFERFYRADPARSAGGAGLGLAISRWIAEAHGGRIEVVSQPGAGSTFTVRLPLDARGAEAGSRSQVA